MNPTAKQNQRSQGALARSMRWTTVGLLLLLATAAAQASDWFRTGDAAKGQAVFQQVCASCHGPGGETSLLPEYPLLGGQHAGYLVKQMSDYKTGRRADAVMNAMIATVDEAAFADMAAFLSEQPFARTAEQASVDARAAATAASLYDSGDSARGIPACIDCHAAGGVGVRHEFPRLAGQQAKYLEIQLSNFRAGARANEIMAAVAAGLSDDEIKSIALYLSQL